MGKCWNKSASLYKKPLIMSCLANGHLAVTSLFSFGFHSIQSMKLIPVVEMKEKIINLDFLFVLGNSICRPTNRKI